LEKLVVGKKRGRKPVVDRISNPSSPSEFESHGKDCSPEERDDETEPEYDHEHEHENDHENDHDQECLSDHTPLSSPLSSSCSSSLPAPSQSNSSSLSSSCSIDTFSYEESQSATEDLQKYLLLGESEQHLQQQQQQFHYQLDQQLPEEQGDQRLIFSQNNETQCENDDALVPSLTPPQYKEFVAPCVRSATPAIFLGVDESRSSKVFIRSTTRSLSDLLQFQHGQLEGMDFRDLMPRVMFRSCLLSCYQKVLENQENKQQLLVFTIPTILKARTGLVPVELTFNVSGELTETAISRVDVRELSIQEALTLSLPIFNTDLDDSGIMNPLSFDDYLSFGLDQTC